MPTTFSTAFPAIATTTSPLNASEIPSVFIAGVSASTNQSDTNAAPTLAPTSTATAIHSGQEAWAGAAPARVTAGSARSEKGRLAANTARSTTAHATLSAV